MNFHQQVMGMVLETIATDDLKNDSKLYRLMRLLAKYRSQLIANTLIARNGLTVRSGPFAGMILPAEVAEGCFVPKLLGCYELELHSYCWQAAQRGYDTVINIGCAEGYYAIGLARLLSQAVVWAYDINPRAQEICLQLAEINQVSDRLKVGGEFKLNDFEAFAKQKVLLVCDIEGAELQLLDPDQASALRKFDILLEMHDGMGKSISQQMMQRFESSHNIELIGCGSRNIGEYPELQSFEHLDQLLAVWEWRLHPTPWAFMESKSFITDG